MAKFHENVILTGCIDSFCLVCEDHLRSEEDAKNHLMKPIHKKNVDVTPYMEKYKDDHIRKVKRGYYCEFCNLLLLTAAKAGLHVTEESHLDNRGRQQLKRVGDNVVALNELFISKQAWHGLLDDTCIICNTEFDDEGIHCTDQSHVLNLVQKKVEFGVDKAISRVIDDTSFQCLTCNQIFALDMSTTHFNTEEHKKLLESCIEAKKQILIDEQKSDKHCNEKTVEIKQNEVPDDNSEKQIVACDGAMPRDSSPESSSNALTDESSDFAKQNELTYNKDINDAYCRVCKTKVPSSLKSMKEHVSGIKHKTSVTNKSTTKPFILKKPMRTFLDDLVTIDNFFFNDVVVNDKFCVTRLSYFMITTQNSMRCQTCEVNLDRDDVKLHLMARSHKAAMENTPVINNFFSEFVREVRPEIYHCGFCNLIVGCWDDLDNHFKCTDHCMNKDKAARRLALHRPGIERHREERVMELFMRMAMGHGLGMF